MQYCQPGHPGPMSTQLNSADLVYHESEPSQPPLLSSVENSAFTWTRPESATTSQSASSQVHSDPTRSSSAPSGPWQPLNTYPVFDAAYSVPQATPRAAIERSSWFGANQALPPEPFAYFSPGGPYASVPNVFNPVGASLADSAQSSVAGPGGLLGHPQPVAMPKAPGKRSANFAFNDAEQGANRTSGTKQPCPERRDGDFSSVVKDRLQSNSRVGQACDRCKVRKIRCDPGEEACSNCKENNLICNVTDRVTKRTVQRGYVQQLERDKKALVAHIRYLHEACAANHDTVNIPKEVEAILHARDADEVASADKSGVASSSPDNDDVDTRGALTIKEESANGDVVSDDTLVPPIPGIRWESRPDWSNIGVSADKAPLSSIRGTELRLLGTTIETASFDSPDIDEPSANIPESTPVYNKSVQAFWRSATHAHPPAEVKLPSREEAVKYANWYFMTIWKFLPVIHKPTFLQVLTNMYDDATFMPSTPELVQVHMVFAMIYFQYGVRNGKNIEQRNEYNDCSNRHYHYALSKMFDLLCSSELAAIQALALIASHTRGFPKPGCGSAITSIALHRAIELDYHRAMKKPGETTNLENELRKRAWWVIMTVVVAIDGKRGVPLPVSVQDFDVDFPEPIADELLSNEGVDTSRTVPCTYEIGIAGFKVLPIYLEMYANLYSVRREPRGYKELVASLEAQVNKWEDELPEYLSSRSKEKSNSEYIFARLFRLEFTLCLRHPSMAMTTDAKMMEQNSRLCEKAASELLGHVEFLGRLKSLDTTWYQMSMYCVAALSYVVPHWERRFTITAPEFASMTEQAQRWMAVINQMGNLLGCGDGVPNQINALIQRTVKSVEQDMGKGQDQEANKAIATTQRSNSAPALTLDTAPVLRQSPHLLQQGTVPLEYQRSSQIGKSPAPGQERAADVGSYYLPPMRASHGSYSSANYMNQPQRSQQIPLQYHQQADASMFYPDHAMGAQASQPGGLSAYGLANHDLGTHQVNQVPWGRDPWHSWTTAIADASQDQFGTNTMMAMGGEPRPLMAPLLTESNMNQPRAEFPMVAQTSQWPHITMDQPHQR